MDIVLEVKYQKSKIFQKATAMFHVVSVAYALILYYRPDMFSPLGEEGKAFG